MAETATKNGKPSGGRAISGLGLEVFSTGQVAAICNVSNRCAAKWIDSGKIRGHRLPADDAKFLQRRVYRNDLITFLREHGFTEAARKLGGEPAQRYLLHGLPAFWGESLLQRLTEASDASGVNTDNLAVLGFEAARTTAPAVLLAAVEAPRRDLLHACRWLAKCCPELRLVGVAAEDDCDLDAWWAAGCGAVLRWPCDPMAAAQALKGGQ